jgi:hypothetical protein
MKKVLRLAILAALVLMAGYKPASASCNEYIGRSCYAYCYCETGNWGWCALTCAGNKD